MTRMTPFSSPLLLGFDTMEKTLERIAKSGDGYPPYNIERLRGEPRPDRVLLAFAEGVFANANRFIRACMSLDASLHEAQALPARDAAIDVATRMDAALAACAHRLRDENAPLPAEDGALRKHERAFAAQLREAGDDSGIAAQLAEAFDRMTDSIDTLAHVLRGDGRAATRR